MIVEFMRVCVSLGCSTGLVMQLQYAVGYPTIDALESAMANTARRTWARHPNIHIAGSSTGKRVGIVSFQVRAERIV